MDAEVDHLHRRILPGGAGAHHALVAQAEGVHEEFDIRGGERPRPDRNVDPVDLPVEAEPDRPRGVGPLPESARETVGARELAAGFPLQPVETPVHPVEAVEEAARQDVPLHHHPHLAGDGAVGGELGGQGGDDELLHAEPGGVAAGVLGTGAAEGIEGEVTGVMAPLDGDSPDEVVHLLAGDLDDPVRRLLDGQPQGDGDVLGNGVGRRGRIEAERPAQPVDQTEHGGGIGHRR